MYSQSCMFMILLSQIVKNNILNIFQDCVNACWTCAMCTAILILIFLPTTPFLLLTTVPVTLNLLTNLFSADLLGAFLDSLLELHT